MSIDSTFKPMTQTYLVGVTAVNIPEAQGSGVSTFRVRLLTGVTTYLTWGPTSAVTSKGAPTAGNPVANTIGMGTPAADSIIYIEVPANSWFIASAAASFEITGGEGGSGG